MMRFSQDTIEKVREACDIVEIVGEHVSLKKSGQNFKGLCPFHSERTPSFTVSPAKQVYHCFGCGAGGNVISFIMQVENLSFVEALRSLAKRKGIELPRERSETDSLAASLLSAVEYAASFYRKQLASPAGKKAREYLEARGVAPDIQEEFSLGYAAPGWDGFLSSARKYFAEPLLVQAGLLVPRESGSGFYDRFRDRLMFPILSAGGRAIGFGGRTFDEAQPKYINSSDSPIFQKGHVLYGLYQAKKSMRAKESALVVEGYMDLLALYQTGFQNVVASCGTAFTPEQAKVLRRYTTDSVLIYDGDEAGINAARRALRVFVDAGLKARLVCLPSGHDPDSYVRQEGAEGMRKQVDGAWSVTEFVLRTAPEGTDRESNIRSLIEVYALIDDPIYRRLQIQEGAESLRFDESTIAYESNRARKQALVGSEGGRLAAGSVDRVERELIKLIVENESLLGSACQSLSENYFKSGPCREAFVLLKKMKSLKESDLAWLLNAAPEGDVRSLLSSVMLEDEYGYDEPLEVFADYVRKLRLRWLNESIRNTEEEIRKKEASSDTKEMRALLSRLQELVVERSSLNGAREEALG